MILRKIIYIVANSCQILRLECTKFDFGWGLQRSLRQTPQLDLRSMSCQITVPGVRA